MSDRASRRRADREGRRVESLLGVPTALHRFSATTCPECGARPLAWLSWSELEAHLRDSGAQLREGLDPGELRTAGPPMPYRFWWCHCCSNGGLALSA